MNPVASSSPYSQGATTAERLVCFCVLGLAVTLAYMSTLHLSLFAAIVMPVTALDRALPAVPAQFSLYLLIPYLSFFALLPLPLILLRTRRDLLDGAFGFAIITALSALLFTLWPTAVPAQTLPALRLLDLARNACPSLHASLAVFCGLCIHRQLRNVAARAALWSWIALMLTAALLLRQHVILDLIAGAALGAAIFAIVFRRRAAEAPDTEPTLETLRIRRSLAQQAPEAIAALVRPNLLRRAREFAVFVPLAAAGMALARWGYLNHSPLLIALATVLSALALNTFPLLMHEGMHDMLLPRARANWALSVLLGGTFLMSFTAYRVLHTRHHRYLGDPRDPDDYHNYSRNPALVWLLHFVRLAFGSLLYIPLIPLLAVRHGSDRERKLILIEYTILLGAYSLLLRAIPAPQLLLVWIMPLLLVATMTAIRGFTQHGITDTQDPYLACRTMLPHPVVAFLLLNENYHLEHHLFPEIPSYNLGRLHRLIWPKIPRAIAGRSYLAFLGAFFAATPRLDESPIGLVTPPEL